MTPGLALSLLALALVDSLSVGTLVVPLALLVRPQVPYRRLALYLATISAFYFALGLALLYAGVLVRDGLATWGTALDSTPAYLAQLLLGVGLVALSYRVDPGPGRRTGAQAPRPASPSWRTRWRTALLAPGATPALTIAAALTAGVVEAATMLPYLAAIGVLTTAALPLGSLVAALGCYVVVMCLPALVLTVLRASFADAAERPIAGLNRWLDRHAASTLAWALGIVGVLLALHALPVLQQRWAG